MTDFVIGRLIIGFRKFKFIARLEIVMSRVVMKVAVVILSLSIFQAFELNMTRFLTLSIFKFLTGRGYIGADFNIVTYIELQSPDNVSGILNVAALLERFKRYLLIVIHSVKTAYHDKCGICFVLKCFEFVNNIVNASFIGNKLPVSRRWNNLQVV